jgi:hypothetical protein
MTRSPSAYTARSIAWAVTIASFALLFVGNMTIPEVRGVDYTPFELAGPPFFVVVVPAVMILGRYRHWRAAVIAPLIHGCALTALMGHFLGWRAAGVAVAVHALAGLAAWQATRVRRVGRYAENPR